ncbi:MAG TPA: DMT family transporter [Tepidisphaeraceae bacterium]|jgi:drug/metabolite transporter (DMT)-like permease
MTLLKDQVQAKSTGPSPRAAELALLFATLVWGSSFTWAKASGDAINRITGAGQNAMAGPAMLMAARFMLAGALWMIAFPQARRGWTRVGLMRGALLGLLVGTGLILQVLGLDRTTEAVSAFLTSLTILWVPAIMTLWMRKPPTPIFWAGVVLAGCGIWLMTGAMPAGFGRGEVLGLACSIAFSFHIIALNAIVPRENAWRMTGMQLLVAGALAAVFAIAVGGWGSRTVEAFADGSVSVNLVLLILFPTFISFGIMSYFQPAVDASRATLIYLMEPIFAAAYAWMSIGRRLGPVELFGAALILAANVLVEVLAARSRKTGEGADATE